MAGGQTIGKLALAAATQSLITGRRELMGNPPVSRRTLNAREGRDIAGAGAVLFSSG
jgi:hypothetical protein